MVNEGDKVKYEALLNSIKIIKSQGKKETYYKIKETNILDNDNLTNIPQYQSFIVSKIRQYTETEYNNKTNQTLNDICADIIDK